jgi:hypothetical protein
MSTLGIRFALGYASLAIGIYVAHVLFGLPLGATVTGLAVMAATGFALVLRRQKTRQQWPDWLSHPAFLLILLGVAVTVANGGVGYLPFTHDEFSHWLATPRLIHLSGSWAAVEAALHVRYYTPGWQLMLLLPWQISGREDFGLSAAAPFVLHVTVIALMYDFVVFRLRHRIDMSRLMAALCGWAFILLFLTAEGMGRLWTYTLLIEQPQIYSYATVLLLIFAAETSPQDRRPLYTAAGVILASAYLYKVAALVFVPAVIGLACLLLFERTKAVPDRIRNGVLTGTLLAGPILVAAASWSMAMQSDHCSPLPLSAEQFAKAASLDWRDLAVRFSAAVRDYAASYKLILTAAAALGVATTLYAGKYRATLVLVLSSAAYFLLLYLYHLTCFGPYYFENLASIERFTRVPLQAFHALGLVMLSESALGFFARKNRRGSARRPLSVRSSWMAAGLAVAVLVMMGWQARQVDRSVADMTARTYQGIDPRIAEARQAAKRIEALRGTALPRKPSLAILSQGQDNAVVSYAMFFAMGYENERIDPRFTVSNTVSWSPKPGNHWQAKAGAKEVAEQLSRADIIWPITLDPWLTNALSRLVPDPACLKALPGKALIRERNAGPAARFKCIPKQGP